MLLRWSCLNLPEPNFFYSYSSCALYSLEREVFSTVSKLIESVVFTFGANSHHRFNCHQKGHFQKASLSQTAIRLLRKKGNCLIKKTLYSLQLYSHHNNILLECRYVGIRLLGQLKSLNSEKKVAQALLIRIRPIEISLVRKYHLLQQTHIPRSPCLCPKPFSDH